MKTKLLLLLLFSSFYLQAQVVGTPFMVTPTIAMPLDLVSDSPSFAFSTRKLKSTFTGFALRARKSTDNSEVNVAFDSNNQISDGSLVTYVVAGTSGQAVGATTTLGSYKGSAQLFVTTWYDQSGNGRNAAQSASVNQPELLLASQNNQAVVVFNGTQNIPVTATAQQLLGTTAGGVTGVVGTLLFTSKITSSVNNPESFGFKSTAGAITNIRFQMHLNWSDGTAYFDAGGQCCGATRNFANAINVNKWKQYTMQRQDVTKIGRVSGVERMNGAGEAAASPTTSYFGIGATNNITTGGHIGHISEMILFNKVLTTAQITTIENNQMAFWNSY